MSLIVFGDSAFRDRGLMGMGVPGYSGAQGYQPSDVPTAVGARMFFPEPEYDPGTDQALPAAQGNKWDGGRPAYQTRVYAAAKKVGKDQGLKGAQIDDLKPKQVA